MFRQLTYKLINQAMRRTKDYIKENKEDLIDQAITASGIGAVIGAVSALARPVDENKTASGKISETIENIAKDATLGAVSGIGGVGAVAYARTAPILVPIGYGMYRLYDERSAQKKEIKKLRVENEELHKVVDGLRKTS